ncbi:MAG: MBL fold metallo-hydrolase [Erysipelotrichaceae bacterium]|nr:MBL fold metallo-hydrolase [Erysipelotrichaceae bacterium]
MEIRSLVCGAFATNTYVLENNDELILIDPACKAEKLDTILEGKKLLAVLLTHGHFDHIKACDGLYKKHQMPIYMNMLDDELTKDNTQGESFGLDNVPTISSPITDLKEGKMNLGSFSFEVIFTPGHTRGSVCYLFDEAIFTGDTLFRGSVGRTDLKGGCMSALRESLRIFKEMNEDLLVYPGHEEPTCIGDELKYNPYF